MSVTNDLTRYLGNGVNTLGNGANSLSNVGNNYDAQKARNQALNPESDKETDKQNELNDKANSSNIKQQNEFQRNLQSRETSQSMINAEQDFVNKQISANAQLMKGISF